MINNYSATGRLTARPELKTTSSGTSVTSFCIAIERRYTSKDGSEKQADFIDCVAWSRTAEFICKYFDKGDMIGIDGPLQTRTYDGKNGYKVKATEVNVEHAHFCGAKSNGNEAPAGTTPEAPAIDIEYEDLPWA